MGLKEARDEVRERARAQVQEKTDAVRALAETAKAQGRDFTDDERAQCETLIAEANAITAKARERIEVLESDAGARETLDEFLKGFTSGGRSSGPAVDNVWSRAVKQRLGVGSKDALQPSGSVTLPSATGAFVVAQDAPATLTSLIAIAQLSGTDSFSYLRETVRDHNAHTVARGYAKPTSDYAVERVEGKVVQVATLSQPVDNATIADVPALSDYVGSSLLEAVRQAIEDELVNGDGTATGGLDRLVGVLNLSGTQAQAFDTDAFTTVRRALVKYQLLNRPGTPTFVMSPNRWAEYELAQSAQQYVLGSANGNGPRLPASAANQTLWGVRVALSQALADDVVILGDFGGSAVLYARDSATVTWSEAVQVPASPGDSSGATVAAFSANQRVFRAEQRVGVAWLRPDAFVICDVTA